MRAPLPDRRFCSPDDEDDDLEDDLDDDDDDDLEDEEDDDEEEEGWQVLDLDRRSSATLRP
jgi:hypothetical protein